MVGSKREKDRINRFYKTMKWKNIFIIFRIQWSLHWCYLWRNGNSQFYCSFKLERKRRKL